MYLLRIIDQGSGTAPGGGCPPGHGCAAAGPAAPQCAPESCPPSSSGCPAPRAAAALSPSPRPALSHSCITGDSHQSCSLLPAKWLCVHCTMYIESAYLLVPNAEHVLELRAEVVCVHLYCLVVRDRRQDAFQTPLQGWGVLGMRHVRRSVHKMQKYMTHLLEPHAQSDVKQTPTWLSAPQSLHQHQFP